MTFPAPSIAKLLAVVLLASIFLGGGGVSAVASETIVIALAFAIAAYAIGHGMVRLSAGDALLCALLPSLAAAQLIPLPADIWRAMPGREAVAAIYDAAGAATAARPLSLSPLSTFWSLLAFAPPVLAFALTRAVDSSRHGLILVCMVVSGCLSAGLGAAQFLLGDAFFLHPRSIDAGASGLFANQNSQALFCAIALIAVLRLPTDEGPRWLVGSSGMRLLFAVLLVLGGLLTGSRAGLVLLIVALGIGLLPEIRAAVGTGRAGLTKVAFACLAVLVSTLAAAQFHPVARVLARYANLDDGRISTIWPDAVALAAETWPAGIGMGSFKLAFPLMERLELVDPYIANRAHSDWLEFLIEGGIGSVIVVVVAMAIVAVRWRRHGIQRSPATGWAIGTVALVALHSLVDYPLRTIALATIAAVAFAIITPRPARREHS